MLDYFLESLTKGYNMQLSNVFRRPLMLRVDGIRVPLKKDRAVIFDYDNLGLSLGDRLRKAYEDLTGIPIGGEPDSLFEVKEWDDEMALLWVTMRT